MYIDAIHFIWRIDETRVVSWIYKKKKKFRFYLFEEFILLISETLFEDKKKKNMERFGI